MNPTDPAEKTDSFKINPLSPRRHTSRANNNTELIHEQIRHFGIDPGSDLGRSLAGIAADIYNCHNNINSMWQLVQREMRSLDKGDRIALFNAKKFLSFQLAKVLDTLQQPFRESYQSLQFSPQTLSSKGPYPVFDNVTALFSATPVIVRTATYIYACAEWIADAFEGKELLLEIYSRLLNPTSISLANHIVDLEAGPYAHEYMCWNFNSGMAAIDATLSHLLGHEDIIITSRNIYGGAHQLIHDWFAKSSNLDIAVELFKGEGVESFTGCLHRTKEKYRQRLLADRHIYVYLESPCNPHGYVLDLPGICQAAHTEGIRVILDATVGTPFLQRPLQRQDPESRPDFLIHSYTKDLSGHGSIIAGCVIARNEDMFCPKGEPGWDQTMFWNVYYVKGAFLTADAAFEVIQGMRTLELRMLKKCINTQIFADFLNSHPDIQVNCNALADNENHQLCQQQMFLGLPAPLFTIDLSAIPRDTFQRFFDILEPAFGHMISLGQTNTIVSCPGLTTHSELSEAEQHEAGIFPATVRFAMGIEDPKDLIDHFINAAREAIDRDVPGFSGKFMTEQARKALIRDSYVEIHRRYVEATLAI